VVDFADRLIAERERLGLSQVEAAELLSIPARTYWGWENGDTVPAEICQEGALARMEAAKPK